MLKNYFIGQRRPINLLEQTGFLNNSRLRVKAAALPPALAAPLALLIQTEGRAEELGPAESFPCFALTSSQLVTPFPK